MPQLTRSQVIGYAVAAVLVVVVGVSFLPKGSAPAAAPASPSPTTVRIRGGGSSTAVVDVTGAVRRPGVYRLRADQRVDDALRRAGGPAPGADLTAVNRAARLTDGAQIVVPQRGAATTSATASPSAAATSGPVNLNTASVEQLDALDGIGPTTAQKIVAYRQAHGGFGSVAQLDQIPGIGPKRLAALRGKVTA